MIVVEGLRKDFRALTAVHDMSFTVGDGEIFGLLGPARPPRCGCWPG
jgi:ABC-2 type transport system ATP-binding protein